MRTCLIFRRQVEALRWFHSIDFGNGLISPGGISRSKIEQCSTIVFGRVDVTGKSVLDIACWDGAYSIEAVKRGASRVLATDHWVWHNGYKRKSIELARTYLAPSIEVMDIDVPDISLKRLGSFDVVLFLGLFYHLRHPVHALERAAEMARECLVVESRLLQTFTRKPMMQFCPGSELDGDKNRLVCPEPGLRRGNVTGPGVPPHYVHVLEMVAARDIPRLSMSKVPPARLFNLATCGGPRPSQFYRRLKGWLVVKSGKRTR